MEKEIIPAGKIRKAIAKRMTESWHTSPRVSYTVRVDATNMQAERKTLNAYLTEGQSKVSYNIMIMKACAIALTELPDVNASFDGEHITRYKYANIGLAVDTNMGLMVPNIKHCEQKTVYEIAAEMDAAVLRAKAGKLKIDDMSGGTFTVSNLGGFGIEHATPIINPPELAILGVYAMQDTPVAENGAVVIRPLLTLTLVADHRVIDGVLAARFLKRVKDLLEAPTE